MVSWVGRASAATALLTGGTPLRACHPRDAIRSLFCGLLRDQLVITRDLIDAACKSYFVGTAPSSASIPPPSQPGGKRRRLEVH